MNFILTIILLIPFCYGEANELLHIHTIFRHGDRAPLHLTSSNKTKFWPNGLRELTDIGIKQQFHLGQWLRQKYDGFLSKKFNSLEVYVRSTDFNRTLMSAESNLAGMYYNEDNMIIPNLKWRPIPVHTIPRKSDIVMIDYLCEKYNIRKDEMMKSEEFYPKFQKYQFTLDLIKEIYKNPNMEFQNLSLIYDILSCEINHHITWDNWVTDDLYKNLTAIQDLIWQVNYHSEELQKLSGGLFLNEIIIQLKRISDKPNQKIAEKLRIYSGHDMDVAALMSAIGVYNGIQPPYASCFIIELWKNTSSNFNNFENVFVKMYFKNNLTQNSTDLPELILKDCNPHPCSLRKFIEVVKPRTMNQTQYYKECFTTRYKKQDIKWKIAFISIVVILVLVCYIKLIRTTKIIT